MSRLVVSEFTDSYSDDLIYIEDARKRFRGEPNYAGLEQLTTAVFCRLYAVFMVGSIDAMLAEWKERDRSSVLEAFFSEDSENRARVDAVHDAFRRAAIAVERAIFEDYLAIKHLRNVILHHNWRPSQQAWLKARGFPLDTRYLDEEHWRRMRKVKEQMMLYIVEAGFA